MFIWSDFSNTGQEKVREVWWTMEKTQISILTAEKLPWGICDEVSAMSSLEPGIIIRLLEKKPTLLLETETAGVTRLLLM